MTQDNKTGRLLEDAAKQAARTGTPPRWNHTPIGDTGGAVNGGRWWQHAEPQPLKEQTKRFASKRASAFDRVAYAATPISEHMYATPEGYVIAPNVVIARSGFQTYKVAEIADPENLLRGYSPDESLELWRDVDEVFSPATVASFEGKPVTLAHPGDLLHADSDEDGIVGHVQNVHRGSDVLESGDVPLVADLFITKREGIDAVKNGCELSCGYSYRLSRLGSRFEQKDILGNHVALVLKGRAGAEVSVDPGRPVESDSAASENYRYGSVSASEVEASQAEQRKRRLERR